MAKRLIKSINIMSASGDTQGIERIDSQIKALILSMVGTIPGSRGFGLEREFISRPDIESDDSLAERIYIAPSKYSVAGPEESYRYWVKTFNSSVTDVYIDSENPTEVLIEFIMNDADRFNCRVLCRQGVASGSNANFQL